MLPAQPFPRRFCSLETAAEQLGCSPRTVRRYVAAGRLTGYKLGPRLVQLDAAEVERLLRPLPTVGTVAS